VNIIEEIKSDIEGAKVLAEWWGNTGHHVSQEQADHRSLACLHGDDGKECPHNKTPNWWQTATGKVAETIRRQIAIKEKLSMRTAMDDHLKICHVCKCALPVKIWVPIKHISAHTSQDTIPKFPPFCWVRKEIESL
jgi:hypothetical protein